MGREEIRAPLKTPAWEASETRARVKIFLSLHRVSDFLAWDDFHALSRVARSTIPEEKLGTTRSLQVIVRGDKSIF